MDASAPTPGPHQGQPGVHRVAYQWEVSIVVDTASRYPVGVGSRSELEALVAEANRRINDGDYPHPSWKVGAVLIQRADQTLEAKRQAWFDAFYDLDRRGYKRRRYKRPAIEVSWEAWAKEQKRQAAEDSKIRNAERG